MKIRLLRDLPMISRHKCTKDQVFDVTKIHKTNGRADRYYFTTKTGKDVFAVPCEVEVIMGSESPEDLSDTTSTVKTPENESEDVL